MSKRVLLVVVLTFAALVGAALWVPASEAGRFTGSAASGGSWTKDLTWCGAWELGTSFRGEDPLETHQVTFTLYTPGLAAQLVLVALLGGGLLTWVVRRERRRRATT